MIAIIKNKMDCLSFATMFRKVIALIFLLAFIVQTFSAPFVMLDYYTNTGAYAKNCVNKTKPKMHCNGKCQMMKKIREEEKKEKENSERKYENKAEVLSSKSFYATLYLKTVQIETSYPAATAGKAVDMPQSFFHPPGA